MTCLSFAKHVTFEFFFIIKTIEAVKRDLIGSIKLKRIVIGQIVISYYSDDHDLLFPFRLANWMLCSEDEMIFSQKNNKIIYIYCLIK